MSSDSKTKLNGDLTGRRFGRRPNADSQCGRFLERLKQGPLNSDAIRAMGIRDGSTRIWDLRHKWGIGIRTDENRESGIATYSLVLEPLVEQAPARPAPVGESDFMRHRREEQKRAAPLFAGVRE